jgi:hypothetical protein
MIQSTWSVQKQPSRPEKKKFKDEIDRKKPFSLTFFLCSGLILNHVRAVRRNLIELVN